MTTCSHPWGAHSTSRHHIQLVQQYNICQWPGKAAFLYITYVIPTSDNIQLDKLRRSLQTGMQLRARLQNQGTQLLQMMTIDNSLIIASHHNILMRCHPHMSALQGKLSIHQQQSPPNIKHHILMRCNPQSSPSKSRHICCPMVMWLCQGCMLPRGTMCTLP